LPLGLVYDNISRFPYASEGKDERGVFGHARKYPKSIAVTKPYIQKNGQRLKIYLPFDIDRQNGGTAWMDANLPAPNFDIIDPHNGHAHLVYELAKPIWLKKPDDPRPGEALAVYYMQAVYTAMRESLKADINYNYNALLVKNPLHSKWTVRIGTEQPYTLGELAEHLDLNDNKRVKLEDNFLSRNCNLFDSVRFWAYKHRSEYKSLEDFRQAIYCELEVLNNQFRSPLPTAEIKGIVKSVSKYWNYNRHKAGGVYANEDFRIIQQKKQKLSAQVQSENTAYKIRKAVQGLFEKGENVNRSSVRLISGLSKNTISKNWNMVEKEIKSKMSMIYNL